jgi:hypothetical protein
MAQGKKKENGGKRDGAGRKEGSTTKTARDLMNEMGCPPNWLSPVEFCLAVMNNDMARIGHIVEKPKAGRPKKGVGKGNGNRPITIGQRIEAARIATPYFHQKLPEIIDLNPGDSWAQIIREAEERERTMVNANAKPH